MEGTDSLVLRGDPEISGIPPTLASWDCHARNTPKYPRVVVSLRYSRGRGISEILSGISGFDIYLAYCTLFLDVLGL
jgi:hypothetical protein